MSGSALLHGSGQRTEKEAYFLSTILINYDDSLVGRIPDVESHNFYGASASPVNEHIALECIRYAIEDILQWSPETALKKFDRYILSLMKLNRIAAYIVYPAEVESGDPLYILSRLYPDTVKVTEQDFVKRTFESILRSGSQQFPREYFIGGDGFRRFCFCMKYVIENFTSIDSVEELYKFMDSPQGKRLLYRYRLKVPADQFFISILDVCRYITRGDPDSELYYAYYSFIDEFEKKTKKAEKDQNQGEKKEI